MYTYSQLLFRHLIFGLIISTGIAAFAIFIAKGHIVEQQKSFASIISAIPYDAQQSTSYVNQLKRLSDFQMLEITENRQNNLLKHEQPQHILLSVLDVKSNVVNVKNSNITVDYRLAQSGVINLLTQLLIILFATPIVASLIAGHFSLRRYANTVKTVGNQIVQNLSSISNAKDETVENTSAALDLPEVNQALNEVQEQIQRHISAKNELEVEAYTDSITKLDNRNRFIQYFDEQGKSLFGVLTITRCSELQNINQIHGYSEGDKYIKKVSDIIKNSATRYPSAQIFRLNSSDFATILPNTTLQDAEKFAESITNDFNMYQSTAEYDSIGYTGLVAFDKDMPLGEMLALADTGISVAQTKQTNAWYAQTDTEILENTSASYGNQNWRQEIENVLENQRVTLLVQPISPTGRNSKVYGEVLARFLNSSDEMLPTASFIAMAEKLDKIVAVDRMIIEQAISEIINKNLQEHHFGINISARSIHDEHFLIWLERRLLRDSHITSNLIFEITEHGLQQNIKTSKRFIDMIHRVGARITVERFGVGLTSFKFFRDLKPDFIKMDSTYTRDIDEDKNNQYFLRTMVDLAHRLSITVLAESVESQEEKFTLEKLFIDGCQGFYIGKPKSI